MREHFFLNPQNRGTSPAAVLADLRRIAALNPPGSHLSARRYRCLGGRFSITLILNRFGSWNNALRQAGLPVGKQYSLPNDLLFDHLEKM